MLGLLNAKADGNAKVAARIWGGTAAFPKVVRNASLGVDIRRRPATWANFW